MGWSSCSIHYNWKRKFQCDTSEKKVFSLQKSCPTLFTSVRKKNSWVKIVSYVTCDTRKTLTLISKCECYYFKINSVYLLIRCCMFSSCIYWCLVFNYISLEYKSYAISYLILISVTVNNYNSLLSHCLFRNCSSKYSNYIEAYLGDNNSHK